APDESAFRWAYGSTDVSLPEGRLVASREFETNGIAYFLPRIDLFPGDGNPLSLSVSAFAGDRLEPFDIEIDGDKPFSEYLEPNAVRTFTNNAEEHSYRIQQRLAFLGFPDSTGNPLLVTGPPEEPRFDPDHLSTDSIQAFGLETQYALGLFAIT